MNRLARSRTFLAALIVLLQVAMLPGKARILCMLKSQSLQCCCDRHAAAAGEGASQSGGCCSRPEAKPASCCESLAAVPVAAEPARDGGGDDPHDDCQCDKDAGQLPPFVADADGDPTPPLDKALLAPATGRVGTAGLTSGRFVLPRLIPRARTGPPLHALFGVWLI